MGFWTLSIVRKSTITRTEADQVSETSCYLVILDFRTMDKVQKSISSHLKNGWTYVMGCNVHYQAAL